MESPNHVHSPSHLHLHKHKHPIREGDLVNIPAWTKWAEKVGPFDSSSHNYHVWNVIVIGFVLYNAIIIPIRVGFEDLWAETYHWAHIVFILIDYIGDIFFLVDICVNLRTTYMYHGIVHTDTKKIAWHYLTGNFVWDLLASIPIDLFAWSIGLHAILRANRLIRLKKVSEYFGMWELNSKNNHGVVLLKLILAIILYLHWIGCFYIAISYYYGFGHSEWEPPKEFEEESFWALYLLGFFWAVRVVTGQGGEVKPPGNDWERLYTMSNSLLALMIGGYIIGSIVNLIQSLNAVAEAFRGKLANINLYINNKKLPNSITEKSRNYYKHLWSRQGGIDDDEVLNELPLRLRTEVCLKIHGDILQKVPFFQNCNPGFINSLVNILRPQIYIPGDEIVTMGDVGSEMYLISQGEVEVVVNGKVVTTLGEGGFFGEIAVLFESKRTATIRAKTYCDISTLLKADLDKTLKSFPEQKQTIQEIAQLRMTKDSLREIIKIDFLFKNVQPHEQFVTLLQDYFKPTTYQAGDLLYSAGDKSDSMMFLGLGTIAFLSPSGQLLKQLKIGSNRNEGCFFGDLEFLLNAPRTNTCKIVEACTILSLSRGDFEEALKKFSPEVRNAIFKTLEAKEISDVQRLRMERSKKRKDDLQQKAERKKLFSEQMDALIQESHTAPREDVAAALQYVLEMISDAPKLTDSEVIRTKEEEIVYRGLTASQLEDAKRAFKEFDMDGNGAIDKDEFFQLMEQILPNMPRLLVRRIADLHFQTVTGDGASDINENKFLIVYSDLLKEYSDSL